MTDHNSDNLALQKRIGELNAIIIMRDDQLRELQQQLAQAKHDTERLDWLEQYGAVETLIGSRIGGRWAVWNHNHPSEKIHRDHSLRQAIDTAMQPT